MGISGILCLIRNKTGNIIFNDQLIHTCIAQHENYIAVASIWIDFAVIITQSTSEL